MKILIIDDNKDLTKMFKQYFTKTGNTCVVSNDGPSGLLILQSQKFEVIILDLAMPDFSGKDVVEELRNNGKIKDNNIVCLTASSPSNEEEEDVIAMGVKKVLRKPIDPDVLLDFIKQFEAKS